MRTKNPVKLRNKYSVPYIYTTFLGMPARSHKKRDKACFILQEMGCYLDPEQIGIPCLQIGCDQKRFYVTYFKGDRVTK